FLLKLLFAEGVLHLQTCCNYCDEKSIMIGGGESLCSAHGKPFGISFSEGELLLLIQLSTCHLFSELDTYTLSASLLERTQALFTELIC
ncbi:MAG: hypothetical protein WCP39_07410, partial [Chlamydiota bacterium]